MQKIKYLLLLLISAVSVSAHAQFVVSGTVLDSTSREPLGAASVFCQNTTLGTATNKQGEFTLNLKSGGYDLIFSYTGYKTQTIRISDNNKLEVLMTKEEKSMGEVVLRNSFEVTDGLSKYGSFFMENFIGATPNGSRCTLLNPEALKFYFYKRTNRLKVLATEPVKIANHALGYNLHYQLDSFVYYYNTSSSIYRGYCLYSEMEGTDSLKKIWSQARKKAYEGSRLHFMRSFYDSTLTEEGWIVDLLDEKDDKKFNKIPNVYDSVYYNSFVNTRDSLGLDSVLYPVPVGPVEVEIYFPRKISVTYTKKRPEAEYTKKMGLPRNVPYLISYIDIREAIAIMENGYYYDQKDWVNQGYWSWKNLGDQLPYDYTP
ncbi:MAG TPA: carboxypeptidase-like regulatory domain-containing protein [Chitinophagaceae bacterium]|nr:carboxypeptidase-like regulatory domain-containing protein [Chitinophagaceae bacterium]HRG91320.1 carboxypeptidase-like regulatory domain-containing protein [Chitinophagaceae bacterium]